MTSKVLHSPQHGTFSSRRLKELIGLRVGEERIPGRIRLVTDTTDFFRVDYGDVALLGGRPYLIRNNEKEGRFGLDEEQKFWVKRSVDLLSGEVKIIKLSFLEEFQARVGEFVFDCRRSPLKEARLLELVRGHHHFMQGFSVPDEAGNTVRIIDFISGSTLADHVLTLGEGHEEYFIEFFPAILDIFIELTEAIKFLHDRGEKHGDIRRDHIIREKETGNCRWIDMDFNFYHRANPYRYDLFGLGNVLAYLVGRGDVTTFSLQGSKQEAARVVQAEDLNIVFQHRVVNLRKIYPYIPEILNRILLHFAVGADSSYESIEEFLEDLKGVSSRLA